MSSAHEKRAGTAIVSEISSIPLGFVSLQLTCEKDVFVCVCFILTFIIIEHDRQVIVRKETVMQRVAYHII